MVAAEQRVGCPRDSTETRHITLRNGGTLAYARKAHAAVLAPIHSVMAVTIVHARIAHTAPSASRGRFCPVPSSTAAAHREEFA